MWGIGDHAYATDSSQPVVWRFDLLDTEAAPEPIHLKDTGPKVYPNGTGSTPTPPPPSGSANTSIHASTPRPPWPPTATACWS
ncbi:hypothetical protein ACIA58_04815 [Kribbella sp. NPDC051586]|uniref:hypothetical protein n=1 Tax=Kribbella sp. NPDC051586 TaxID=3364118 RepID=UPI0037B01FF4